MGFRSAYLQLTVDADALNQDGMQTRLHRFCKTTSLFLRPFYGDVRTLAGYTRRRGRYWFTHKTQQHPVQAWWWPGIPTGPAQAIVLGPRYLALWNSFTLQANFESGCAFVDTGDWKAAGDVLSVVGPIPSGIAQVNSDSVTPAPAEYPSRWPFGPPRI